MAPIKALTRTRIVLAGAVAAVLALLLLVAPLLASGWAQARVVQALSALTGHAVTIARGAHLRLLPYPSVRADGVRADGLAVADRLVVRPSLPALLGGRFRVAALRAEGAAIGLPGGSATRIEAIDADIDADPFRVRAAGRWKGRPVILVGGMDGAALDLRLSIGDLRLQVVGTRSNGVFAGQMVATGDRVDVRGTVSADGEEVRLTNVAGSVDGGGINAGLVLTLTGQTHLDAALALACLDLDARAGNGPSSSASVPPDAFDVPDGLFADLRVAVGQVTWRGGMVRDLRFETILDKGELVVEGAEATLPGATRAGGDATLRLSGGRWGGDGHLTVASADLPALSAWAGVRLPGLQRFGGAGDLVVGKDEIRIDRLALDIDGIKAGGAGIMRLDGGLPLATLRLTADRVPVGGTVLDNAGLTAEADASGTLRLAVNATPAGSSRAFSLSGGAAMDGRGVALSDLDLRAGETRVTGQAAVDLRGRRPNITADLKGGRIDLATLPWFSPPPPPAAPIGRAAPAKGPPGKSMPSPSPSPSSGASPGMMSLSAFDARVTVAAETLVTRLGPVDNASAQIVVENGDLDINHGQGRFHDGDLKTEMRLTGGSLPQFSGTIGLTGADLGRAGLKAGPVAVTAGRLNLQARFSAIGRGMADLERRLTGDGALAAADGAVSGVDLGAIDRQTRDLSKIGNLLAVVRTGMNGGSTRFSSLTGRFTLKDDVIASHDLRLVAEGGEIDGDLAYDAGRATIAGQIGLRLAGGDAPPVVLRLDGPLNQPRTALDVNDIQRWLAAKGMGSALRGGGQGGNPLDGLRGLLRSRTSSQ